MRLLKLYTAAVLLISAQISYGQNCPDDVSTDPRNPSNSDRPDLENTFFWFPHDGNSHSLFQMLVPGPTNQNLTINNPFWNTVAIDPSTNEPTLPVGYLVRDQLSDFYPEDGWELIKVDFGYLNDGTPRQSLTSMPYMMLYNRYTGTLRFLGMWPNSSSAFKIIRFILTLPQEKIATTGGTGAALDATNLLSVQGDAIQPLDQQTEETVYEVITEYPGISNYGYFFWFDLPVAYDPCICNSDVAITLQASVENQWDLTVKGVLDAEIIQQGSSQNGSNSGLITKRIIGAAGATATAIATGGAIVDVGSFTGLIDIFTSRPGIDSQTEGYLNLVQEALNVTGNLTWNQETQEWRNSVDNTTMNKSDWKKLFSGLGSFLNAGVEFANPSSSANKPKTSVVGSITATGTATLNIPTGDYVYLGVPGSNWTSYLDETEVQTTDGKNPEYPIYNNPLGTFALLKTPKLDVRFVGNQTFCESDANPNQTDQNPDDETRFNPKWEFRLSEDLLFKFNDNLKIDPNKTEILVSFVVREGQSKFRRETCGNNTFGSCCSPIDRYQDEIREIQGYNLFYGVEDNTRITPPVPLDYARELVFSFTGKEKQGGITSSTQFDYFIRFTIDMFSENIGSDGRAFRNQQILTFPMELNNVSEPFSVPLIDIENDISNPTYNTSVIFSSGQTNFSDGYVLITEHVQSDNQDLASILSSSVIHLKPGAQVSRKMRLAIDYPFQGLYPQQEVSASYLSDFCANNLTDVTYQANQFSAFAPQLPPPSQEYLEQYYRPEQVLNRIVLSPNPARDLLTLRSSHLDMTAITIHDLSGRPIKQETLQAHSRETQINLSGIAPGTYIVRVDCGDEVFSEKLVVTK